MNATEEPREEDVNRKTTKQNAVRCWVLISLSGNWMGAYNKLSEARLDRFFGESIIPGRFIPDSPKKRTYRKIIRGKK